MNESEVIKYLIKKFGKPSKSFSNLHDDVAFMKDDGYYHVFKVDMLVESTDVPPLMRPYQIARKSIVSCVSDLIAKGVKPIAAMISLGLPRDKSDRWIRSLIRGFVIARKEYDIEIIGGDTNESKELVIDCFMYGRANRVVKRKGARIGDRVLTVPIYGYTKLGLLHLLERKPIPRGWKKKVLDSVFFPKPPVELGVKVISKYATSSMDSSDGLSITLNEIASINSVGILIYEMPTPEGFIEAVLQYNYDPVDLVFFGGEEYQPVFTVNKEEVGTVIELSRRLGIGVVEIGEVIKERGVFLRIGDKKRRLEPKGWIHLT